MSARPNRPTQTGNVPLVLGLMAFTGLMAATPILLQRRHMRLMKGVPMMASDKPLTDAQVN